MSFKKPWQRLREPLIILNLSLPPRNKYGVNSGGSPVMSKAYGFLLPDQVEDKFRRNDIFRDSLKKLSGLLPICASCKKIRDDKGYWNQIESYLLERSEAEFSHSLCPDCMKKLYPDL
jgi:hypothetical protein